jgi:hypothetical protein
MVRIQPLRVGLHDLEEQITAELLNVVEAQDSWVAVRQPVELRFLAREVGRADDLCHA